MSPFHFYNHVFNLRSLSKTVNPSLRDEINGKDRGLQQKWRKKRKGGREREKERCGTRDWKKEKEKEKEAESSRFHRLVVFCLASLTKRYRKKKMESVRKEKERLTPGRYR